VLNTGARIDEALLPKLFDPFYRVDKARSRKSGRNGLGLTIVQKTLKAMDIDFALENTPDGVLFRMDLPKA
jgi:two-component system sensor histidine kinase VanS